MSSAPVTTTLGRKLAQNVFNKQTLKYVFTTHFWGPVSNFGIPIAAIMDLQNKPADTISGPMTLALTLYSAVFMRYSLAITPKNYLLLGCHIINEAAQLGQGARYLNYHYLTGASAKPEGKKA
ncbi:pyruvate transporter mpc1 [Brettanomyces nanus]|uniref:Mitochondrial pyruvate carrier n=1 Tax=Eeniella nana TaxID=13502 RepID=A0A875S700_EENNA|nr:pyruvate transporter mpc1 [Brettanomyces nanus]QPG77116.1 pyruvate transporter mpc1 [Brettanomyces nanus]